LFPYRLAHTRAVIPFYGTAGAKGVKFGTYKLVTKGERIGFFDVMHLILVVDLSSPL
jgi:hypothetical protein